jgi:hypothetical protein
MKVMYFVLILVITILMVSYNYAQQKNDQCDRICRDHKDFISMCSNEAINNSVHLTAACDVCSSGIPPESNKLLMLADIRVSVCWLFHENIGYRRGPAYRLQNVYCPNTCNNYGMPNPNWFR